MFDLFISEYFPTGFDNTQNQKNNFSLWKLIYTIYLPKSDTSDCSRGTIYSNSPVIENYWVMDGGKIANCILYNQSI